jgi:hypothetical protein
MLDSLHLFDLYEPLSVNDVQSVLIYLRRFLKDYSSKLSNNVDK